jgi:hypothetical protein
MYKGEGGRRKEEGRLRKEEGRRRRKKEGGTRKEEGGKRKEEGGTRKEGEMHLPDQLQQAFNKSKQLVHEKKQNVWLEVKGGKVHSRARNVKRECLRRGRAGGERGRRKGEK